MPKQWLANQLIARSNLEVPKHILKIELDIENIVEKPNSKRAPSNLFAVGRYIFSHELISFLSKTKADKNGEIQLTDAIDDFLKFKKVVAHSLDGKFYDCGEKLGYLIANIEFSMKDNDIKKNIKSYFK